jgi:starch synthase
VRDLPAALADNDWQTTVVTPSYGMFHELPGAKRLGSVGVGFRGTTQTVDIFDVPGGESQVRNIAFEHPNFSPLGPGHVYCGDEPERPFANDANKFAFFCATAAAWIDQLPALPDVVHLHDWHAAFYLLQRNFAPEHEQLRNIRSVFTIHNLSYQGTRPLRGDESSLEAWFPDLNYDESLLRDPASSDCINPMALAIRSADRISTVSPTYAREIRQPSDAAHGFVGGEGLEVQLENAANSDRLVGILNGCVYHGKRGRRPAWRRIASLAASQVTTWLDREPGAAVHALAESRLTALPDKRPSPLLVSIGRLVRQKTSLFLEELADGRTALEHIAEQVGHNGVFILLGSGEAELEQRVLEVAKRCEQLIFLRGYSESLAAPLYRGGDLFLMPSSFEPCGISQMLAMRAAQPCVVHAVGGLRDTVEHDKTGFVFCGDTPGVQAAEFVATVEQALALKTNDPNRWRKICVRAAAQRFDWATSARHTVECLYGIAD